MPVYLYGNANGTYQPPNIDVFALAKAQNNKPVLFKDTEAGKNMPAVKVNISAEGLRALHGTKLPGSMDVNAMNEQRKYESDHIPIESFYSRLSREYSNGVESVRAVETDHKVTWADKENALLNGPKMAIVSCQRMRNWIFFSRNLRNLPNPGLERNSRKPLKW